MTGVKDYFVLFFMHIGSRRVIVTGMTPNPNAAWVAQQARDFLAQTATSEAKPTHLIHDCDTKFTEEFKEVLKAGGAETVKVGPCQPNLNAHAERFVLSIRSECLDHFMVLGEQHLRYLISEYLAYYLQSRPHQGMGNVPLTPKEEPAKQGKVQCKKRLGGLLKDYYRQAA